MNRMGMPREPGVYPAVRYDKITNTEGHALILVDGKGIEEAYKPNGYPSDCCTIIHLYDNESPTILKGPYFHLEGWEIGPKLEFPKGGWRK